jgi:ADP-heptose:LPS heptosyltransferase
VKISDRFDKPSQVRRVLIIQLGDIGDVVWSLPAVEAVRAAYPGADVSLLLREGSGSLFAAEASPPGIFEVRKGKGGFWGDLREAVKLIRDLRREHFDLVFDFRADERGGYMAFITGAPIRAAQHYASLPAIRNRMFTHLVMTAPLHGPPAVPAETSLPILRAFGIEAETKIPSLNPSVDIISRAERILMQEGLSKASQSWMTLNPFSRWSYKEWQPEKWVRIIDWLGGEFGMAVVVVGAQAERERAAELAKACSRKVCNLAGKTTLAELAGVLHLSPLHIGVDSAAPHIAAAVGTPTVTLYGPSDWRYWAPPGDRHRVIVPDMACAPCRRKGCDDSEVSRCLDTLEVEQVQAVLREALSEFRGQYT